MAVFVFSPATGQNLEEILSCKTIFEEVSARARRSVQKSMTFWGGYGILNQRDFRRLRVETEETARDLALYLPARMPHKERSAMGGTLHEG
ncbi:MAG: hypothetical protein LUF30_07980 [Lachnospiraceae bacterium]|nr:hypothetical protein [Lachnospiraceae bacterium]